MSKKGENVMKKFLAIFLAITVIFSFAAFAVGSSSDDSDAKVTDGDGTSTEEAKTENGNLRVNVGEVLETNKVKITYVSTGEYTEYSQYLPPKEGNKIVYIELKAENICDSDVFVSFYDFNCYADNNAMEAYYGADEELSATLSAGRTTSGKVYFEVPKDAESIEFEYEMDFWDSKKAIFVVK